MERLGCFPSYKSPYEKLRTPSPLYASIPIPEAAGASHELPDVPMLFEDKGQVDKTSNTKNITDQKLKGLMELF
jgi:hypothetical protein